MAGFRSNLLAPYPAGIPMLRPYERLNKTIVGYLCFAHDFTSVFPASRPMCTDWSSAKWAANAVTLLIAFGSNHAADVRTKGG